MPRSDSENLHHRSWSSAYYRQHPDALPPATPPPDAQREAVATLEALAAMPWRRPVYPRMARKALDAATLPLLLEAIAVLSAEQARIQQSRATVAAAMPRLIRL